MSQQLHTYRVTFKQGTTMVFSFPGDLPKLISDAVRSFHDRKEPLGFLLLDEPRILLDLGSIAVVHPSAYSTETQL